MKLFKTRNPKDNKIYYINPNKIAYITKSRMDDSTTVISLDDYEDYMIVDEPVESVISRLNSL